MLTASCHCGAVRLQFESPPDHLNECHCSVCRRYGIRWAYHRPDQVRLVCEPDATQAYSWGDRMLDFHRCRGCGCVTHWTDTDKNEPLMAINGRLLEPSDIAGVPVGQFEGPP